MHLTCNFRHIAINYRDNAEIMESYILENSSLNEIISLFDKLLHVRITFFDIYNTEPEKLDIPVKCPYCAKRRKDRKFDAECRSCDIKNLEIAKQNEDIHIYECHAGMIEAIVPLYDKHGEYLGALFFGQMRNAASGEPYSGPEKFRSLFEQAPPVTFERAHEIARLLKLISEYIINHELIKFRREQWVEILKRKIDEKISTPPTISEMARLVHHSESFLTHNFSKHFDNSPKQYIQSRRMEKAKELLANGKKVYEIAAELGFYDEFHFSKTFKKYFGKSPARFPNRK